MDLFILRHFTFDHGCSSFRPNLLVKGVGLTFATAHNIGNSTVSQVSNNGRIETLSNTVIFSFEWLQ